MKETKKNKVEVKKQASKRLVFLIGFGILAAIGLGCFVVYFLAEPGTGNMAVAVVGALMGVIGGSGLYYFWQYGEGTIVEHQGGSINKEQVNSLCWYSDEILFQDVENPKGRVAKCHNDNKYYYVHIFDKQQNSLAPFKLPDQQYLEPAVLGQRVLDQPAHRKLFRKRETLLTKLRPGLLIIAIFVVGILMLITTGE